VVWFTQILLFVFFVIFDHIFFVVACIAVYFVDMCCELLVICMLLMRWQTICYLCFDSSHILLPVSRSNDCRMKYHITKSTVQIQSKR